MHFGYVQVRVLKINTWRFLGRFFSNLNIQFNNSKLTSNSDNFFFSIFVSYIESIIFNLIFLIPDISIYIYVYGDLKCYWIPYFFSRLRWNGHIPCVQCECETAYFESMRSTHAQTFSLLPREVMGSREPLLLPANAITPCLSPCSCRGVLTRQK